MSLVISPGVSTDVLSRQLFGSRATAIFPHRFTLYIPSMNASGIISTRKRDQALEFCRKRLRILAGGTTEVHSSGSYVDSNQQTVSESVLLLSACFSDCSNETIEALLDLCRWLKATLDQESIAAELDSLFYLF